MIMNIEEIIVEMLEEITPDMLPKPYNQWAEIIGMDNLYKFIEQEGGRTVYLPRPDSCFKEFIKIKIISEHKEGLSIQKLATKYGLSKNTVQKYINERKTRLE